MASTNLSMVGGKIPWTCTYLYNYKLDPSYNIVGASYTSILKLAVYSGNTTLTGKTGLVFTTINSPAVEDLSPAHPMPSCKNI